jgi:hypothetical protein
VYVTLDDARPVSQAVFHAARFVQLGLLLSAHQIQTEALPNSKGAQNDDTAAPLFPILPAPSGISNTGDAITAGLGQQSPWRIPDNGRIPRSHVAIFVSFVGR